MASNIYLSLGSNKGNRAQYLQRAVKLIQDSGDCSVDTVSSVYIAKPYGLVKQDEFYNCVIEISTSKRVTELLTFIKQIEVFLGRKDTVRWGPREIDIDILFYNQLIYNGKDLIIPHLDFLKRDFVIIPLQEINPDFVHPIVQKKIGDIDTSTLEKHIIRKLEIRLL